MNHAFHHQDTETQSQNKKTWCLCVLVVKFLSNVQELHCKGTIEKFTLVLFTVCHGFSLQ
jgi:hypothetical protein